MIPIGDENPTRRFPIVNYSLIAINIVVFLYELSLGTARLNQFIATWGVYSQPVAALLGGDLSLLQPVLVSSLTSMFLHGGWMHIISNMLFLWIFGDNIEDNFGSLPYLLFYLLCGYGAVVAQAALTPTSEVPAIGASGAISGVLAAYLLLYPTASIRALLPILLFMPVLVPAWAMLVLWFITQLLSGAASLSTSATMTGGVAYGAHIGGFIVGFAMAFLFRRPERRPRYPYHEYLRR